MEREIKFRAKDYTGSWQYGFIMAGKEEAIIVPVTSDGTLFPHINIYVEPETIGQYTGLHDVNGKEIYEGDIVVMKRTPDNRKRIDVMSRHIVTCYSVADWSFSTLANEVSSSFSMCNFHEKYSIVNRCVEVIGNIHDNPELAKPYSLNLPEPKRRKKRDKGFQVEFVVSENPKPEPYIEGNKLIYEVTQEEMNDVVIKKVKEKFQ